MTHINPDQLARAQALVTTHAVVGLLPADSPLLDLLTVTPEPAPKLSAQAQAFGSLRWLRESKPKPIRYPRKAANIIRRKYDQEPITNGNGAGK